MKNYFTKFIRFFHPEALIWISGLIILYFIKADNSSHFTVCPFNNLGIEFCPGCGLGKSIHYLLHMQFEQSLNMHPFGIFAFAVLVRRIAELMKKSFSGQRTFYLTKSEYKYDQSLTTNAQH